MGGGKSGPQSGSVTKRLRYGRDSSSRTGGVQLQAAVEEDRLVQLRPRVAIDPFGVLHSELVLSSG